ncbi:hypothetical protein GCM10008986_16530 [Salinibacillus aidingensis]|uniref:Uncharacterized protein n=1 Tax=Salinibacillus aidingensis TaxID=237684 RepID=A0ABP3L2Z7_9BACI
MEQVDIYEYFGFESDPLFQQIKHLDKGSFIEFQQGIIRKNEMGILELETEDIHEASKDPFRLYEKITAIMNEDSIYDDSKK